VRRQRVAADESRRRAQILGVEQQKICGQPLDFRGLGRNRGDVVARSGELDHSRGTEANRAATQKPIEAMITAFVMFTIQPGLVKPFAEGLLEIDGVTEVYSVSGPFDLVAVVRVKHHEDLADLVTQKIATLDGIVRTETLIAFRAYSKRDPGLTWDVGG
jgi:DNA-binding Lrp family transcriptional regulator